MVWDEKSKVCVCRVFDQSAAFVTNLASFQKFVRSGVS